MISAPNMSAIAKEFGFSEKQKDWKLGGEIAFGFFLMGAPISLIVGYLADVVNRCILFAFVICIGETACLLTYWSKTYIQLFVLRTLTGISIGGAAPIIFSILADYYPGSKRVYVATMISMSMSIGIAAGQEFSGLIGPDYGWRLPFLLTPIPSLICTLTFVLIISEPARGGQEDYIISLRNGSFCESHHDIPPPNYKEINVEYKENINFTKLYQLLKTKSVLLIYIQGIPGCVPWGIIYVFLNDYLSADRGFSVSGATAVLFSFAVGGFIGQIFGGWLGQKIYNINKKLQCIFMGITAIIGVFPFLYILNGPVSSIYISYYFGMSFLAGFSVSITGPNVRSVLQNVTSPEIRGTAFAFFNLTDDVGKGGGPMLVALMIHWFHGRQAAFNFGVCLWVICGAVLSLISMTVVEDEKTVQEKLKNSTLDKMYEDVCTVDNVILRDSLAIDGNTNYMNNVKSMSQAAESEIVDEEIKQYDMNYDDIQRSVSLDNNDPVIFNCMHSSHPSRLHHHHHSTDSQTLSESSKDTSLANSEGMYEIQIQDEEKEIQRQKVALV